MNKVGVRLPVENDWTTIKCLAERSEQAGVSSLWLPEGWERNMVPLMTRLLEATDTVDVCSGIFNVYSRSPALMAMTARGLCDDFGDRVRLGLGVSSKTIIENFHGEEFGSPLRRTREYIGVVRTLLAGDQLNYDGEFFDVSMFSLKNIERSYDVPIYLAAIGERNLQLTGEFADGWLPLLVPLKSYDEAFERIRRGAVRRDRSFEKITKAPYIPTCISADDPENCRRELRALLAWYVGANGEYYHRTLSEYGYAKEADAIDDAWDAGNHDLARERVTDDLLDALAIVGTPDEAKRQFDRYYEAGIDEPIVYLPPRASDDLLESTVCHLANVIET